MRCRPFIFVPSKTRRRGPSCPGHAPDPRLAAHSVLQLRSIRAKPPKYSILLVRSFNQLLTNRVDQSSSDRDSARKFRQLQYIEPLRVLDFARLWRDLARAPLGDERDHQRMRERPRLAREVADAADAHADFLLHLAREALLERLARLDEAGERAVHAGRKVRAARQQQLVLALISPMNERHHGGREARIGGELARRADARPLLLFRLRARAAAAAKLVRAVPGDQLQRAAG